MAKKKTLKGRKSALRKPKRKLTKKPTTKKKISPIQKGYHSITPYLIVNNAAQAIDFYKTVFNAKEAMRMEHGGKISHAELKIGDSKIMLADEHPELDANSPEVYGGTPISIHLYVKNVDAIVEQAVAAGARIVRPVENMFYGDRSGTVVDPFGHKWHISTHVENVSPAKIKKRAEALFGDKK